MVQVVETVVLGTIHWGAPLRTTWLQGLFLVCIYSASKLADDLFIYFIYLFFLFLFLNH